MMERLNAIAPVLQYQQEQNSSWTLPCEPESIPALQNWLEQLSASIQTDENIYPEILSTPHQQPKLDISTAVPAPELLSADDYDLYPKLDDNNVWTSPATSSPQFHQPTSASESSAIHTPPYYEEEESKPPPLPPRNIKAQFWSPGYIHSPTHIDRPSSYIRKEEHTPSDAINFTVPKLRNPPAPTIVFQTAVEQSKPPTPVIDPTSTVSFDGKKELMHMMNVFSSSKGKQSYRQSPTKTSPSPSSSPLAQTNTCSTETSPTIKKVKIRTKNVTTTANTTTTASAATVVDYSNEKEEPNIKSPYADLVGLIRNMKVEDEATMRKRHARLIDQLWKAVARLT
jgi:hypothetical protein